MKYIEWDTDDVQDQLRTPSPVAQSLVNPLRVKWQKKHHQ